MCRRSSSFSFWPYEAAHLLDLGQLGDVGIGNVEADVLQNLVLRLDVVVHAGRLHAHLAGQVAHRRAAKAL